MPHHKQKQVRKTYLHTMPWALPFTDTLQSTAATLFAHALSTGPVPQHIGFIMDGNRRYARTNNIELSEGHSAGFESMAAILELCYKCGVRSATVFAFSIENFKRGKSEVSWLMELAKMRFRQLVEQGELCETYGVRIRVIGDRNLLPSDVRAVLEETEELTRTNDRAVLNVCFPYTSRHEMTHSMKRIVKSKCEVDDIDEAMVERNLFTGDQPPLDLLIRTSGVQRLSDFMLWQVCSEGVTVEMLDLLWPELKPWHIAWLLIKWSFDKAYKKTNPEGTGTKLE